METAYLLHQESNCLYAISTSNNSSFFPWFRNIPPERVGLSGEYDHSGLAKRVRYAFEQQFSTQELQGLKILQRGGVVVLLGNIQNPQLLNSLVGLALQLEGATGVEFNGSMVMGDALLPIQLQGLCAIAK